MTDDFLHTVARAYALAALKGLAPAPAIAEQAGVSRRAVHKWTSTARKRGSMPPVRADESGSHRVVTAAGDFGRSQEEYGPGC